MSANIVVPQLGESVVEARIARWLKQPGERVQVGEPLVELETDKIDLEVPADQSGVLLEVKRGEGEDVLVGDVLGVIGDGDATAASSAQAAPPQTPAQQQPQPRESPAAPAAAPAETANASRDRSTPTARKMAKDHAVDLNAVTGTGDAGRVTKRDVANVLAKSDQPAPTPPPGGGPANARPSPQAPPSRPATPPANDGERRIERVRMSKRRATIARNLVEAQHAAAMLTTFNEVDMSAIMALRERRKATFKERYGVGLGIASFFVKAAVGALKAFPRLNAEVQGEEMVLKHFFDIGIAVGASQGLVVPVIRDADRLSFAGIEQAIRDFARRVEDSTLTFEDLKGGTFTITNGGVFGSLLSTPILNPPQVGILGLHKIEERPVALNGQVVVRPMMYVALSYDHRIVDGLEAVQFLVRVKEFAEDPGTLLLES